MLCRVAISNRHVRAHVLATPTMSVADRHLDKARGVPQATLVEPPPALHERTQPKQNVPVQVAHAGRSAPIRTKRAARLQPSGLHSSSTLGIAALSYIT